MAKIAVRSFMETELTSSRRRKTDNADAVFIVGKGKRSDEKPMLLPAISQLLKDEYDIVATLDERNTGRLRISNDCIEGFIERKKWRGALKS
jgi:hypothetical protein